MLIFTSRCQHRSAVIWSSGGDTSNQVFSEMWLPQSDSSARSLAYSFLGAATASITGIENASFFVFFYFGELHGVGLCCATTPGPAGRY